MGPKYFPIRTETACQLKWNWSTLYLSTGKTYSCHRTGGSTLTVDNFDSFHNTQEKINDRQDMLKGQWPKNSCGYCKEIEANGGFSDRNLHLTVPDMSPPELDIDPTAVEVTPTILEVYFNNTCNLRCVYCKPAYSSRINDELTRFGDITVGDYTLTAVEPLTHNYIDQFWSWFSKNVHKLKRIHVLGGEAFVQPELETMINYFDMYPAPQCEFNIVTNLNVSNARLREYIQKIKLLVAKRKLKRLDITASVDCWGEEQSYIRGGFNQTLFEENFSYLMSEKWIKLNINQVISVLSIKTTPELIEKLNLWKSQRNIGHYFSTPTPDPVFMHPNIFGAGVFDDAFNKVLTLMKTNTEEEQAAHRYMHGIWTAYSMSKRDNLKINNLVAYLDILDSRRKTNWKETFPWLVELV